MDKIRTIFIVTGIFFLALILRFYQLDIPGLDEDEFGPWYLALSRHEFYSHDGPLFILIERFWMVITGITNDFNYRIIPAFSGAMSIPISYFIGKEIHNKRAGIILSFIFAFSPLAIHYSQEGRPYSLLLCMNTLMILFYIRALK